MASFFRLLLAPLTIVLAWLTITASWLAYLAPYISPTWVSWLPFFGLFYPLWAVMQVVLLPFLYQYKKKVFMYMVFTILAGYGHFFGNIQPMRNADKRLTTKSLTLLSYNMGGDGLHKKLKSLPLFYQKVEILRNIRPNILCLQESRMYQSAEIAKQITQPIRYEYRAADTKYGTLIYSDFPIRRHQFFAPSALPNNVAMYADIALGERTVRVFNVHLRSNALGNDADNFVKELDNIDEQEGKQTYIRTYRKLRDAWQKRTLQANIIADSIASSPYPVIVCGDFNDTPSSYSYRVLGSGLRDAFRNGGRGASFSYNGNLPALSIDHVFVSPNYPIYGFRVVHQVAADHYPVRVEVGY